jgi:regulator of protease activity HflC (stomatin/prohibitin superfamily)
MTTVVIVLVSFILIVIISNIRIVSQSNAYVIERIGAYHSTWGTGIRMKLPFLDRIAARVTLKEQVVDFAPQPVITKDNVTMMIDSVIFLQITDPKLYSYGVINPFNAIENLATTTLRNIIGELELDETLTSRDMINQRMRLVLDEATDPWGIKVNRVELRNITPPKSIQEAMEKQMRAERERRESILKAEGEKQSAILVAEGQKASAILRAEAEKAAVILQAEAAKEAAIREAEGEAQAILNVQKATADGLNMLKSVNADDPLIKLKSLEALQKVADGQATKIIIPSEIQNLAGLVTGVAELVKK